MTRLPGTLLLTTILAAAPMPALAQRALAPTPVKAAPAPAPTDTASSVTDTRVASLLSAMSDAEKLRYVQGYFPPFFRDKPADMIPSAGYVPGVPRLGIPTLRESDASLGVANQVEQRKGDVATALPASLALAASFSPDLAYRTGAMIGAEARAKTFNVLLAGGVNLTRDPWGGRTFEYLGEDPWLSGVMAGESIRGVQSNKIVSTVKHFILNPQETGRTIGDAQIGEAALRESDLLAFQIAIERGRPGSVMCAYNKIGGDWACENAHMLTDVLKRDWGYKGWVMSDWGAVHSTVKAANAGLDQQSGRELDRGPYFGEPLRAAVASGAVAKSRLDDMNRRILWGVVSTGLIDAPVKTVMQPIDYAANAAVAQEAAEAGTVLLKNAQSLLPLAKTTKRVVLIGGHADVGVLSGGGSSQVRSVGGAPVEMPLTEGAAMSFARVTWHASSPLKAIQAMLPGADVSYVDGRDPVAAAAAAKAADVAIVFATQWRTEAQDIETLALPDKQDALIDAVAAANPRSVVVLETGGPALMPWLSKVGAVVQAWYPGQRGGEALARVLWGEVNPSGHLPMTFPASDAQMPRAEIPGLAGLKATKSLSSAADAAVYGIKKGLDGFAIPYPEGAAVGYRWYRQKNLKPLFPFGYGLSYTSFAYRNLKVEGGQNLRVAFDVINTGKVAGADVPQVYVAAGRREGVTQRLIGFERVMLAPGETRHVVVEADARLVADYDIAEPGWHITKGSYPVMVGHDANDAVLTGQAMMSDRRLRP